MELGCKLHLLVLQVFVETSRNSKHGFVMVGIIMQLVAMCSEFKGLSVLNNSILHYYVSSIHTSSGEECHEGH